ncbi:glutamine-hydrolysing NAD+ synthase [Candidatus Kinetoplastibacterium desouzaii TCC079E]|uniref:Glutamine-dependent NAD(+) synthetase n=1 Tax=Candidatus Kinetoplastidibacterium desouzai TCC079E TaxID=1208919 RepID=M1LU89_9PROT|nr:NAD+ synthase [Candidatus Kinetoplastibacterium desouzaii]AGF46859.1 glutamine-hydrolysing NAD+ synthase [Candidatus Kinetoplastibacterium desouzaii TCC079E]
MNNVRIAIAQINSVVGDIEGNFNKILDYIKISNDNKVDLLVTPELVTTGYPPCDLLLRSSFIDEHSKYLNYLNNILLDFDNLFVLIGHIHYESGLLYNAASLLHNGNILGTYCKYQLPNYSVFDEKRYFTSQKKPFVFSIKNKVFGVMICEDLWQESSLELYKELEIETLITLNASPFYIGKDHERYLVSSRMASYLDCMVVYANAVGGQDELIFDGGSFIIDSIGNYNKRFSFWKEDFSYFDIPNFKNSSVNIINDNSDIESIESQVWNALVLSLRNYVTKNSFPGVLIGLSGGIDSALALVIAVDALGSSNVQAVMMPTCYTSDISIQDASLLADVLNVEYTSININELLYLYNNIISSKMEYSDLAKENIQARIRANLLMAISNTNGKLVITTGNKSELATGYCTLYGDMVGGFALLKDVYKTMVYKLAKWRNNQNHIIPERVILRAPTAELRFDQNDQDVLPPYDVLDEILYLYIEQNLTFQQIVSYGHDIEVVRRVLKLLRLSEYKRGQSSIGPKITSCSFGSEWRYPITNKFLDN